MTILRSGGAARRSLWSPSWAAALLTALLVLAPAPRAVQEPSSAQAGAVGGEGLVRSRLAQLEGESELAPELRARLRDLYQRTLDALANAARERARAAEFAAARQAAARRLEEVRRELAAPPAPVAAPSADTAPLSDLESALSLAQAELEARQGDLEALEDESRARIERRQVLPQEIAETQRELDGLLGTPALGLPPDATAEEREAAAALAAAERELLEARKEAAEEELLSYDARKELLPARRELAGRELAHAEKAVAARREDLERRRARETRQAEREAQRAQERARAAPEPLRAEAERAAALALRRAELTRDIEALAAEERGADALLERVQRDFDDAIRRTTAAEKRQEGVGLPDALGLLLRKKKGALPETGNWERRAADRRERGVEVELEGFELEDVERELAGDAALARLLAGLPADTSAGERAALEARAREILSAERGYLSDLLRDNQRYVDLLATIEGLEISLGATIEAFENFINERILWIRSSNPLWRTDFRGVPEALVWLLSPRNWADVGAALLVDARESPLVWVLPVLGLVLLFSNQRRLRRALDDAAERATKRNCTEMLPTVEALLWTLLVVLPIPALLAVLAWRLGDAGHPGAFGSALAIALRRTAGLVFLAESLRQLLRPRGLGEAHFGWSLRRHSPLRRATWGLIVIVAPLYSVGQVYEAQAEELWKPGAGRIALFAALLTASFLFFRALRETPQSGWSRAGERLRRVARLVTSGVPLALAVLLALGYGFTTQELAERLLRSTAILIACVVSHGMIRRWLLVVRRKLAYQQAKERLRVAREAAAKEGREIEVPVAPEQLDLQRTDQQSRQLLGAAVGIALATSLWFAWIDVLPALALFDRIGLWSYTVGGGDGAAATTVAVTLGDVLLALVTVALTVIAAKNLPGFLEVTLLRSLSIGPGERYAVTTVARYAITVVGVVLAFSALGVGWSKVQWLAAAVSVGLGFGLQEIFANFVSGLILLFERPIRVGDLVTIGGVDGRVTRIRMRATSILDYDRRELIVPNKDFVTERLVNWTLTDPITRVVLPVGVAYGSDTDAAMALLLRLARQSSLVLTEPAPSVVFSGFGDSTLDLQLRVFIADRDCWPELLNGLNGAIHREFARAGIEIAFPQRDLHIRSAEPLQRMFAERKGFSIEELGPPARAR